jgi:Immunity protein 26
VAERKKSKPVREGDVFQMPLEGDLAAVGVVARKPGRGIILVYLYRGDPTWTRLEDIPPDRLDPANPLYVGITGWQSLRSGEWPILGSLPGWSRDEWPQPVFGRAHPTFGWIIVRLEDNLAYQQEMRKATAEEVTGLFPGTVHGVGSIEDVMHRILTSPEERYVPTTPEQWGRGLP